MLFLRSASFVFCWRGVRYHVPVHSIVVLLRPKARHRHLDGSVRYQARPGRGKMDFGFEVVEPWRKPVTELLAGELGTAPLAVNGRFLGPRFFSTSTFHA